MLPAPQPPSEALLAALAPGIDELMLREIAAADYGYRADLHLAALRSLLERGAAAPLGWEPREVLQLIRWSEPDDPEWRPGGAGIRGHRMRAFACAVLLRAAAEPGEEAYADGENQTLAQLVDSLLHLDRGEQAAGLRFLTWRVERVPAGAELPFFRLAQLVLAVHLQATSAAPEELVRLARAVLREEAAERAVLGPCIADSRWLLGLTFHQLRHPVWVRLADRLLGESAAIADGEAREAVEEVALRVLCG